MTGATANIPCSQIVDQPTAGVRLERPGARTSKSLCEVEEELVDFARSQGYRLDELIEIIEDVG